MEGFTVDKEIYTLITPEGREVVIGAYTSEGKAKAACKRKFPADWLSLCCYPLATRPLREGETVQPWSRWER